MKMKLYDFHCVICAVDFTALSAQNSRGQVIDVLHEPCGLRVAYVRAAREEWFKCHTCGYEFVMLAVDAGSVPCPTRHERPDRLCPGTAVQFYPLGTKMNFRSSETVPPQLGRVFALENGYYPESRAQMDRVMAANNRTFVEGAWGSIHLNPDRVAEQRLAPETDDPQQVRKWNSERYGPDYVRQQDAEIGEAYDQFIAGHGIALPSERGDTVIHETPHEVDLDRVTQNVAAADETKGLTWACDEGGNRIMPVATEGASTT